MVKKCIRKRLKRGRISGLGTMLTDNPGAVGGIAQGLGFTDSLINPVKKDGDLSVGASTAKGFLKGGMQGIGMAAALAPITGGFSLAIPAITAGVSGIANAIGAKKRNEAIDEEEKRQQELLEQVDLEYDKANLNTYNNMGRTTLYPLGGQLPQANIPQGQAMPLSSNGQEIVNAGTHEQGMDVPVNGGEAMVEQGEVVIDDKVFSKRLGFADQAKILSKQKSSLESQIKVERDRTKKNAIERSIKKIDKQIDDLYNQQEAVKEQSGLNNEQAQTKIPPTPDQIAPQVGNGQQAIGQSVIPNLPAMPLKQGQPIMALGGPLGEEDETLKYKLFIPPTLGFNPADYASNPGYAQGEYSYTNPKNAAKATRKMIRTGERVKARDARTGYTPKINPSNSTSVNKATTATQDQNLNKAYSTYTNNQPPKGYKRISKMDKDGNLVEANPKSIGFATPMDQNRAAVDMGVSPLQGKNNISVATPISKNGYSPYANMSIDMPTTTQSKTGSQGDINLYGGTELSATPQQYKAIMEDIAPSFAKAMGYQPGSRGYEMLTTYGQHGKAQKQMIDQIMSGNFDNNVNATQGKGKGSKTSFANSNTNANNIGTNNTNINTNPSGINTSKTISDNGTNSGANNSKKIIKETDDKTLKDIILGGKKNGLDTIEALRAAGIYLDNAGAMILNERLKNINLPPINLEEAPIMDTEYDIRGALQNLDESEIALGKEFDRTTSSSNVGRQAKMAARLGTINQANKLYTTKENVETQLSNQAALASAQTQARNAAKLDARDWAKYQKKIQTDFQNPMANLNNIARDFVWAVERRDKVNYQDKQLILDIILHEDVAKELIDTGMLNDTLNRHSDVANYLYNDVKDRPGTYYEELAKIIYEYTDEGKNKKKSKSDN